MLQFYLGSVVFSCLVLNIYSCACKSYIQRQGYKFVKEKKSFSEKMTDLLESATIFSFPIVNLIFAFYTIFSKDEIFKSVESKLLEKGDIYKPNEKIIEVDYTINSSSKENENVDDNNKTKNEKKYEDMSYDEKKTYLDRKKEELKREKDIIEGKGSAGCCNQQSQQFKKRFNNYK